LEQREDTSDEKQVRAIEKKYVGTRKRSQSCNLAGETLQAIKRKVSLFGDIEGSKVQSETRYSYYKYVEITAVG
jgi:hypothetical protein